MGMIEDHIAYAEPEVRPILERLRAQIPSLDRRVEEGVTSKQRFTYAIDRQFAELKVQRKCVLVRFFQSPTPDPQKLVQHISHASKNRWPHDKEMRLYDIQTVVRESMRA